VAQTAEDVIQTMNRDPGELQKVSQASQQRTLDEHTAAHRASELISLIEASA
jgi:hypothetical protein